MKLLDYLKVEWRCAKGYHGPSFFAWEKIYCAICGRCIYPFQECVSLYAPGYNISSPTPIAQIHDYHAKELRRTIVHDCLTNCMVVLRRERSLKDWWAFVKIPFSFVWSIVRHIVVNLWMAVRHPIKYYHWRKQLKELGL